MSSLARERNMWRIYALEAKYELLKMMRLPMYAIPTLAFPLMFYLLFGVAMGGRSAGPVSMAAYLLATYGAFGVMGVALFGFGVGVAVERGQGWLLFKRATPMPTPVYFAGKLAMVLLFAMVLTAALFTLGATVGKVRMPAGQWAALAGILIAGAVPFGAFGLAIGSWAGPNSAPAVVNVVYLPLAFASGMWVPIQALPKIFQALAPWLPSYHFAQIALGVMGADQGRFSSVESAGVLAAFAAVSLLIAWACYRRDEGKTFG
ncbi:MAG: type transport system permease protein [Acidobacteriota bacterium]|nr:type transport system permease protein [Acidobacteriota bacterium]